MIHTKRVYAPPEASDGVRILVDRLWPRGVSRASARIDDWRKDLAPSNELRKWFEHDPSKWDEFRSRYRQELASAGRMDDLRTLGRKARAGTITLVYAARDEEHNNAVVLGKLIGRRTG